MRKILYLLLFVASYGFAQNGFIEIEIKDSIRMKPVKFEYNVQIGDSQFRNFDSKTGVGQDSTKIKMNKKFDELEKFLNKRKYKIRPLNNSKYQIHDYVGFWKYGFAVELETSKDLEKLTSELKTLDYITGSIGEIEYDENVLSEKRLVKKILDKAKLKANMIAELTGLKLGRIIEFKEVKGIENLDVNIKDIYLALAQNRQWDVNKNNLFGYKWKIAIIKFETK